ncbi:MAG: DUF4198 domain-containing protein [Limisphaerales bacterium]
MLRRPFTLLVLLAAVLTARGHDFWIEADRFAVPVGQPVQLNLYVGQMLGVEEERPFGGDSLRRWQLVTAAGPTDMRLAARPGLRPAPRLALRQSGTHLLLQERGPLYVVLEPEKFETYLGEEGLEAIRDERRRTGEAARPGRERYRRYLKAILHAGEAAGSPDDLATRPQGQRFEIVPDTSPAQLKPGATLSARVLLDGRPQPGVLVTLAQRPEARVARQSARSDERGEVTFTVQERGLSLLRGVHMQRVEGAEDADWDSFWAACTFAVP